MINFEESTSTRGKSCARFCENDPKFEGGVDFIPFARLRSVTRGSACSFLCLRAFLCWAACGWRSEKPLEQQQLIAS